MLVIIGHVVLKFTTNQSNLRGLGDHHILFNLYIVHYIIKTALQYEVSLYEHWRLNNPLWVKTIPSVTLGPINGV